MAASEMALHGPCPRPQQTDGNSSSYSQITSTQSWTFGNSSYSTQAWDPLIRRTTTTNMTMTLTYAIAVSIPWHRSRSLQRSQIPPLYFQAPHTAPPTLPPETYTYLIQALLSLQGSAYPPTFPYPPYPWPPDTVPPISTAPIAGPSSFYPTNPPIPLSPSISSQFTPSPAASSTTAQDPEGTEDTIPTAEDKRRRNTAASGESPPAMTGHHADRKWHP